MIKNAQPTPDQLHVETAQGYARLKIPPPLIYAGLLVSGMLLNLVWPVKLLPTTIALIMGGVIALLSFTLRSSAFRALRRSQTSVNPYRPTTAIVTQGPYRFTRNPIYLSLAVLYAGLAVMANALWSLLLLLAVMLIIHYAVILPEERYLEQKFGEEYRSYKAKVRRWL